MNKIQLSLNRGNIRRFRFWVQILAFLLLVYGGYLTLDLGNDLPTFSCVFVDKRGGNCFLFGFQHRTNIAWEKLITPRGLGVATSLLGMYLWFWALGKSWCGFLCPLGSLQDWISRLRQGLKIPYASYSEGAYPRLSRIKWLLLALLVLLPFWMSNSLLGLGKLPQTWATPFCMICPGRTILPLFQGDFSQLGLDYSSKTKLGLTAAGLVVTALFLVGSLVKRRFFCFFCPMSALHFIFKRGAALQLIKEGSRCTKCGNCYRACDQGIPDIADDVTRRHIATDNCMMCFDCVAACPEEGCLKVTFLGKSLYQSTEAGFFKRMHQETHEPTP